MIDGSDDPVQQQQRTAAARNLTQYFEAVPACCSSPLNCYGNCRVILEPTSRGYWGHGVRNKHTDLLGDYVLNADDDNMYAPGALDMIRRVTDGDRSASCAYLFMVECTYRGRHYSYLPKRAPGRVHYKDIDTGSGVIPTQIHTWAKWGMLYEVSDSHYYEGHYIVRVALVHLACTADASCN
jgi:hypothetical protein